MVAVFHYSPVDILSVNLPPSVLDFGHSTAQDWIIKEAADVCCVNITYACLDRCQKASFGIFFLGGCIALADNFRLAGSL